MFEVLMIGLGDEILGSNTEDARIRHLQYAASIDHLHVIVWSRNRSHAAKVSIAPNVTVYPVGARGRAHFVAQALQVGDEIMRHHVIRVITTQDPFFTALIGLRLRSRSAKLQIQNHSEFFDNPYWLAERNLPNRALNAFGKWAIRRADRLRVVNTTERRKYMSYGISPERIDVIPVPVNLDTFASEQDSTTRFQLLAKCHLTESDDVLFWVGRVVAVKDLETLLRAVDIVRRSRPTVRLLLGGDLSATRQWNQIVETLDLTNHVRFSGPISRQELSGYYGIADLYVHSSVYEGFGRVLVEAAASGRAVVATRTAGAIDIVRDGETGLLCPIKRPDLLADAIVSLLSDPTRRESMGSLARQHVTRHFAPDRLIEEIVASWRKCAE